VDRLCFGVQHSTPIETADFANFETWCARHGFQAPCRPRRR
jgi:hypothetical protein